MRLPIGLLERGKSRSISITPAKQRFSCALPLNILGLRLVKGTGGESLTNCEECDAPLTITSDAIHGEIVSCKECGASYEIRKDEASRLITLKPADKEQEDWGE